jgi:hypothetical protein
MLFSHAGTVALLTIALCALGAKEPTVTRKACCCDAEALAGLCCGWALAGEFTAGLVVLGIIFFVVSKRRRWARFCTFMFPPLLLIPAYSQACFGNCLAIGYSYQASFPQMHQGFYGIEWPNANVALKLLVSPERGLLFWSPFFTLAPFGLARMYRESRPTFWLCLIIPVIHVAVLSGCSWDWRAGWSLGPRYLSPIVPLLGIAAGFGLVEVPAYGRILAFASIALTGLGTLVDATPQYEHSNPLLDVHLAKLAEAHYANNFGGLIGLSGHWTLVPLILSVTVLGETIYRRLGVQSDVAPNAAAALPKAR